MQEVPVELNLMDKDLSNIFMAEEYNTKIILVADIEKGVGFLLLFMEFIIFFQKS